MKDDKNDDYNDDDMKIAKMEENIVTVIISHLILSCRITKQLYSIRRASRI